MKIIKKKEAGRIRIVEHNKTLFWIIIGLIILLIVIAITIRSLKEQRKQEEICIPASCCHATECTAESLALDCSNIKCSLECVPGTLDCGQGECREVDGECKAVIN